MDLSITTQEKSGYLAIKAVGRWALDDIKALADTIATEAKNRECKRVLADLSEISERPPDWDRFVLGQYVSTAFRGIKVAVVYQEEYITKFFENTAVNLGVLVKVVADKQTALQWLMEG